MAIRGSTPSYDTQPPEHETEVLRRAIDLIRQRLPNGWSGSSTEEAQVAGRRADALFEIVSPDGRRAVFAAEAKRVAATRDLSNMADQLLSFILATDQPLFPLVISRYLSASAQKWLAEHELSYADATGNMRLVLDMPGLYLRDVGATHDPWRGPGRPRGSLTGPPAARVVRALLDFRPPLSVPELVKISDASTGATYRVVDFLEQEMLIERAPNGLIMDTRWRALIERWSKDYSFLHSNTVARYLQPHGMNGLLDSLRAQTGLRYVVTGSLAAHQWASYAPPRVAMIYADDQRKFAEFTDLRPVDSGANVLVAIGKYDVVFDRAVHSEGVTFAAPSQTAVDLLTGPGRNPAEALELLKWMEENEDKWRR